MTTSSEIAAQYTELIRMYGGRPFAMAMEGAQCDRIRHFPGSITLFTLASTRFAKGLHLDAFSAGNPSNTCVDYILRDPGFVREYFPLAHRHLAPFLDPANQSEVLVALVRAADPSVRYAMLPHSRSLLSPDEAFLLAVIRDEPVPEGFATEVDAAGAKEALALMAATYFFRRPFAGSRLWYQMLFLAKGLLEPWQVTRLLRIADPAAAQWPFLTNPMPAEYAETKWWPFSAQTGDSMDASAEVAHLQSDMKTLDVMALQLFFKHGFIISDMGRIASYLQIDDFERRVWFFVAHSAELTAGYLARTRACKAAGSKRVRL